jgi:1-deoxy-D-xylulose-5-phosphate reductoisomerase
LEVIEAHWLYQVPYERIEVVLHPESIVHSMVEFADRSVIAQLGEPDMRVPIQYALTYPSRKPTPAKPLRLEEIGSLHFRKMDFARFPCLRMAYEAGKSGGTMPCVFNAANEVAVSRFLRGEIEFLHIERIIYHALSRHQPIKEPGLAEILDADRWARALAETLQT